jgi:tetratricopeptide (TPR) repeat protein
LEFAPDPRVDEIDALARAALPLLEQADDHAGLVHVWTAISESANHRGRWEEWGQSREQAVHHARLAGQPTHPLGLGTPYVLGPEPADELLLKLDQLLPESAHPGHLLNRARLLAMLDRFAEAWPLALQASERLRELTDDDGGEQYLAAIAALAGDHETAARYLRIHCDRLEAQGHRAFLATYAPMLGRSLAALGRYEEAELRAQQGRAIGDEQDPSTQALWRQVQALVNAHRGHHDDAERLAREAVEVIERTDSLTYQGDALCDLADVLTTAGRSDEAAAALTQAFDRYERKRNLIMVRRVRERLVELQPA